MSHVSAGAALAMPCPVRSVLLLFFVTACSASDNADPSDAGEHGHGPDAGPGMDGGDAGSDGQDLDSGIPADDGFQDAGLPSSDAGPDETKLSMQGVYGDFAARSIPSDGIVFTPRYELWSDGATKRRWILLPPGTKIDNTDQDRWKLPVGARLVKEFTRDGVVVETRIVEATASGNEYRTYVWNAAHTEATLAIDGAFNVNGTAHDVPTEHECEKCHMSEPGGALGVTALQLSGALLVQLSNAGKLKFPIASGATFGPTGNATEVAALGYLHANCGHCHNPTGYASTANNQNLRLFAQPRAATSEPGYTSTVNVTVQGDGAGAGKRIDPGNPTNSAIVRRMKLRGTSQMPLIATEVVHQAGVSIVTDWVTSMTP